MNLPNRLSLFRIVLVPVILLIYLFPYAHYGITPMSFQIGFVKVNIVNLICLFLYFIASITDMLDGYIARSKNMITTFGKFMDPIADKLLTTSLFIVFASRGLISCVPVILMISRDIFVDGCRMMASGNGKVVAASSLGKWKTGLQMITIALIFLSNLPFELIYIPMIEILLWSATFISIVSGIQYFNQTKEDILESK